jgi:protein SCO1/2
VLNRRRAGVAAAVATLGAAAAVVAWFENQSPKEERRADAARLMNELMSGTVVVGGPFSLPDTQGKPRSLAEFRGTPVLLYFGFMYCPDVCPTDLLIIGKVVEALDARGIRV